MNVIGIKPSRRDRKLKAEGFIRRHKDAVLRTLIETEGNWSDKMAAVEEHLYRILRGLAPQNKHFASRITIAVAQALREAESKVMKRKS